MNKRNGEIRIVQGEEIKLLKYNSYKDCQVLLCDGSIVHMDYRGFKNRKTPYSVSENARRVGRDRVVDRINETRDINGKEIKIIRYNNNHDLDILLSDGTILYNSRYEIFRKMKHANEKDRLDEMGKRFSEKNKGVAGNRKTKYGVAILDSMCVNEDGKIKRSYTIWIAMLKRCFNNDYKNKNTTYKYVTCCDEWLLYSNFEKWYEENYYEINNENMELDKDILFKGNQIYSPETCCFVPSRINKLFTKNDKGRNLLIGVNKDKNEKVKYKKYVAKISKAGKRENLGSYTTETEAFEVYKNAKESYIKEVANEYKLLIPNKLYNAMYRWEVKISD